MGMAHPGIKAAAVKFDAPPTAELDPSERGFHPAEEEAGPGEWTQTWDGESGEYYYYNALTRETMWVGTVG